MRHGPVDGSQENLFLKSSCQTNPHQDICHLTLKPLCVCYLFSVQLFKTPWTVDHQNPVSSILSRQEYWSGFPFPSPGIFPTTGIESRSPALQADVLLSELLGKPLKSQPDLLKLTRVRITWGPGHLVHLISFYYKGVSVLEAFSFTVTLLQYVSQNDLDSTL